MLYNLFNFVHDSLGLCFWDLPSLILLLVMGGMAYGHHHNQKKREDEWEKEHAHS